MDRAELQEAFSSAQKKSRLRPSFIEAIVGKEMRESHDVVRRIFYVKSPMKIPLSGSKKFSGQQYGYPDMATIPSLNAYCGEVGTRSDIAIFPRSFDDVTYYSIVDNLLCTVDHETQHARDIAADPLSVPLGKLSGLKKLLIRLQRKKIQSISEEKREFDRERLLSELRAYLYQDKQIKEGRRLVSSEYLYDVEERIVGEIRKLQRWGLDYILRQNGELVPVLNGLGQVDDRYPW